MCYNNFGDFMKKLALKLLGFYRKVTVNAPPMCKYVPSCSKYAIACYENYNFFYASLLTFWRLLRCNPFSKGGYDPIPKIKKELTKEQINNYYNEDFEFDYASVDEYYEDYFDEDTQSTQENEDIKKEESYSDSSSVK